MDDLNAITGVLEEASPPLADTLARHPHLLEGWDQNDSISLRVQGALIRAAAADLTGKATLEETTRGLSDAMDELVAAELVAVVTAVAEKHPLATGLPFAVIAMGKWGARELNYYSDIDLVFVHEPVRGEESESRTVAIAIAGRLMAALSSSSFDGPALNVDADLRPEGTMGPLSRSLDAYRTYYERWGEPWELQALLKARPAAGDPSLGTAFREMADQIVWEGGVDADALRSIRRLKARTEAGADSADIKRGRGGIRDIEFAVQLLQMVHGRFDADLRSLSTLESLEVLARHGYVSRDEATRLGEAYRFLRAVEHRLQLHELKQTHRLPADPAERERLGRSMGFTGDPAAEFDRRLGEVRETARDLHERLYFRPILDSLAGLDSTRLEPAEAAIRLEALGYRDVTAAASALSDLTAGLSRRSRVMHQALPLMLDWLSRSPDPDLGLAQLRILLAHSPDHAALVTLLQTNPLAGERLCLLLGTGKLVGDLMDRIPEFIPRLADDSQLLDIRERTEMAARLTAVMRARPDYEERVGTIRRFVRRRKLRVAAREILEDVPPQSTLLALSDTADVAVSAAVGMTQPDDDRFGVIAMGKWGGRELSYGSDLDLMYVHEGDNRRGADRAADLATILSEPSRHGEAYRLDADLRPEGRKGPLSRSIDSFRRYYADWVEPWEMLALVKARPAGGDENVLADYFEMIEPFLWRSDVDPTLARDIRAMKARVEAERIPGGEDPDFHLKLGPGGLSDVEFLVQLLQLLHGGHVPELRVTGTVRALELLNDAGLIGHHDYDALTDAYLFCTRVRLRLHLQSGRVRDSLPTDPDEATRLAVSLGLGRTSELRELYRRYTRRARRSFESLFFE